MVEIAPFRALRYSQPRASQTSPPHDVIEPAERDAFAASDATNVCHVILPTGDDKYGAANNMLRQWQNDGTMVRESKPAFYLYEIRHGPKDAPKTMRGFFARIALDPDYKSIRRHEKTLPGKRSDRLDLLRATSTNTESIWMLYRDERGWVDEILVSNALQELARHEDEEGNEHRLWKVDRPEAVMEIVAQFEDRTVVIADGHHRYATQVKHWQETGREEDGSILVCLVRDTDAGVDLWPTNRMLVSIPFAHAADAVQHAEGWQATRLDSTEPSALRAAVSDASTCVVLGRDEADELAAWKLVLAEGPTDKGRGALDALAVTQVHERLLESSFGVDPENVEAHLRYSRSDAETVARVASGEFPLAVFVAPEPVAAVLDVAAEGHVMPQKSTYFVPKLRSGLVMGPLDEPRPRKWSEGVEAGSADFRMPGL